MESITFHAALPLLFHGIACRQFHQSQFVIFYIHLPFLDCASRRSSFFAQKVFLRASHYINTAAASLPPPCLSALVKITFYKASRIGFLYPAYLLGCTLCNHCSALISSLGTYINNIICSLNHIQIMLDHNYRIASI